MEVTMQHSEEISPSIYRFPEFVRYSRLRLLRSLQRMWGEMLRGDGATGSGEPSLAAATPTQHILAAWCLAGIIAGLGLLAALAR